MEWGWQVSFPCVGWLYVIVQDSSVEFPNSPGWGRLEVNPPFTQAACIGSGLQDMGGDADLCMVWEASPPASPLPPPSSGCLCQSSALGRNQNSSHRATEMSGWSRQSWAKLLLCVPCAVARRCGPLLKCHQSKAWGSSDKICCRALTPACQASPASHLGQSGESTAAGEESWPFSLCVVGSFICHTASCTA